MMTRAQGLTRLDQIMREIDDALDRRDWDYKRAKKTFDLLAIQRRTLLRWLAEWKDQP